MKNLIFILSVFLLIGTFSSCVAPSGHKNQAWHPHHSNKGGKQYKR